MHYFKYNYVLTKIVKLDICPVMETFRCGSQFSPYKYNKHGKRRNVHFEYLKDWSS